MDIEGILVFEASLTYVDSHFLVSDVEGNGRGNSGDAVENMEVGG